MSISKTVKMLLLERDKKQVELAQHFGMSKQAMNNKISLDRWSGKDLIKVADLTECQIAFILPDGRILPLKDE